MLLFITLHVYYDLDVVVLVGVICVVCLLQLLIDYVSHGAVGASCCAGMVAAKKT
jgi:hypothetical protein